MNTHRQTLVARAALWVASLTDSDLQACSALVGFDGFIDSIIHMVDHRQNMSPSGYSRLRTISHFASRCQAAAGKSTNIERVLIERRFGGNGPLMAGALANLGLPTRYVGAVGDGTVDPLFEPFASRCREVCAVGEPSTTDCLEFEDGKLMFNETSNVQAITWERIVARVGLPKLIELFDRARVLGIVNWSLLGGVPGIWRGMHDDIWPRLTNVPRRLMVDLADPAKRSEEDVKGAMQTLAQLEKLPGLSVTLGLNLAESQRICHAMNVDVNFGSESDEDLARVSLAMVSVLKVDCVVIHRREGAGAATISGESAWFAGPFTLTPRLSTGAGDHFNGGFAFAQTLGLDLQGALAVGCAVSGAYVRDAASPDRARLASFLATLPEPERIVTSL